MTTINRPAHDHQVVTEVDAVQTTFARRALAVLRIGFGLTFLWAFLDKLLALGFSTGRDETGAVDRLGDAAWIHGNSPTEGFLTFGADGPFKSFYHSIAGTWFADWGFMLGLLGIGLALTLGIGMRFAAAAGALLYVMMWTVVLPPENHPFLDEHLLGAVTLVALAALGAGTTWGLGKLWNRTDLVQKHPVLR
ncbi:DoxX family membrane protein [Nocardioides lijunqiniae]|uniref:DoxX family membrane protein n=1 Tax=Nocardioides lijunqiniae TaxID=2760832 RepID=UPI0018789AB2|nr:DoxX family membrane protein [Nocardioides lijunqiniae]